MCSMIRRHGETGASVQSSVRRYGAQRRLGISIKRAREVQCVLRALPARNTRVNVPTTRFLTSF